MTEGKTIGNVNILDLRKTTEEAIAGIRRIGNVNILLYSAATASFIGRLDLGNINVSVEAPQEGESRTVMGHLRLAPEMLRDEGVAGFYVVMGHVMVEGGPEAAAMTESLQGLAGLVVMGHVFCPESLIHVVQPKIKQQMGHFIAYPDDATLIAGSLELTPGRLTGLEKPTGFFVTGSLQATDVIPDELMRKIEYLEVRGSILCAAENAETIRSKLRGNGTGFKVIPPGYRLREGDLTLDRATLESLDRAKLFCTGTIRFAPDAEPSAIEHGLAGLRSLGTIVCPERLKDAVRTVLDLVEDRVIFYEGDLWLFDEEHSLHASRFEYSEGRASVVVTGELRIEPDVEPSVLADRFLVVHNLGEIICSPEQMGAIEARLGIHEGDLLARTRNEKEDERYDIGNANVLAL